LGSGSCAARAAAGWWHVGGAAKLTLELGAPQAFPGDALPLRVTAIGVAAIGR